VSTTNARTTNASTTKEVVNTNFRMGLIINPLAGLGGPAGLKGSDLPTTQKISSERGVVSKVSHRVTEMLEGLKAGQVELNIITASGAMGGDVCEPYNDVFKVEYVYQSPTCTSAKDTLLAAKSITQAHVDLLVFVGGDGTARNVYDAVGSNQTVLGLPAGVKMHSGVFAVTPRAISSVILSMMKHRLVAARMADVRDIDEEAFKRDQIRTQFYGEMQIPDDQLLVQSVKCSGLLDDELMLEELCSFIVEELEPNTLYILGSGGTLNAIKLSIGLENPTLLGVDIWYQGERGGELIIKDAYETQIHDLIQSYSKARIMLSVIGGQGIVLGRGNQQISPRIIEKVGIENLHLVSTQKKILALKGRPLQVDSGSDSLDKKLAGFHKILCGYEDALLYEVRYSE